MKLKIYTTNKAATGDINLPPQFSEMIRPDLVKRAVEVIQSHKRQPYGAKPEAGKRYSAKLSRRRRDYKGSYGKGISRAPRKTLNRRGTQFYWVGAFAPGTVGGRRSHPPKADKIWSQKINRRERRKAIRSAMAATVIRGLITQRGHFAPQDYPFIINNSIEDIRKTKEFFIALEKMGFKDELERISGRAIRAGKGKNRGRRYIQKKGPLVVVSKKCALLKTGINVPGVDVIEVQNLNAELLAPGASIGRLTLYTEGAIQRLEKERLFTDNYQGMTTQKQEAKQEPKISAKPAAGKAVQKKPEQKAAKASPEKAAAAKTDKSPKQKR